MHGPRPTIPHYIPPSYTFSRVQVDVLSDEIGPTQFLPGSHAMHRTHLYTGLSEGHNSAARSGHGFGHGFGRGFEPHDGLPPGVRMAAGVRRAAERLARP